MFVSIFVKISNYFIFSQLQPFPSFIFLSLLVRCSFVFPLSELQGSELFPTANRLNKNNILFFEYLICFWDHLHWKELELKNCNRKKWLNILTPSTYWSKNYLQLLNLLTRKLPIINVEWNVDNFYEQPFNTILDIRMFQKLPDRLILPFL